MLYELVQAWQVYVWKKRCAPGRKKLPPARGTTRSVGADIRNRVIKSAYKQLAEIKISPGVAYVKIPTREPGVSRNDLPEEVSNGHMDS